MHTYIYVSRPVGNLRSESRTCCLSLPCFSLKDLRYFLRVRLLLPRVTGMKWYLITQNIIATSSCNSGYKLLITLKCVPRSVVMIEGSTGVAIGTQDDRTCMYKVIYIILGQLRSVPTFMDVPR